ncbi:hypothetical protein TanjilG_31720 [Lupinus angustifolius]|uniref:Uncharacterized protein n=1 Tax=Lupinus angustifolius TaxID=3871 RepID=A0A4P1RLS5_LUPAN|nr:PREDICTED: benzyl alcohol O-benzoyltransferase-like [Lupinus angustifolius]OIW13831.1 hypothetical protein TanjilG_31720 [Lupinus angustifolius]
MAFSNNLEPSSPPLVFTVHRKEPELVAPATPTPHEIKQLSDIDAQSGIHVNIPVIQFYSNDPSNEGKDPVKTIRDALSRALVPYYPLAGRVREGSGGKLLVDCNEEGVMFIEADADVTLEQFGELKSPFPCFEELLYEAPGSEGVINSPILLIQVTRLKCGGFSFALSFNHTMTDGGGVILFMYTLAQIAAGHEPSLPPPVWRRELLIARDPPQVTQSHHEYEQLTDTSNVVPTDFTQHSFFFGPAQIDTIRRLLPNHISQSSSTFEVLTSYIWRCRTKALQLDPEEDVRMLCVTNTRDKFNPPLPVGYYGNCFALAAAVTTAGKLTTEPLEYALDLIKNAIGKINDEYMHSLADLMVTKGFPLFTIVNSILVLDTTEAGFRDVDFGWGKALYGGIAKAGAGAFPSVNFHVPYKNSEGVEGILVLVSLPSPIMKIFAKELDDMLN